ncbi:hypothetical protein P7K49_031467 [Saguinus oedipus]|uniref:Uncharacterized protein n=1 Tax=Saguinus oedipus TaxID=9490 RepID=A0ABQ9TZH4_SAGOE|nr:hypothetical protein P7K49_031467 [Saguinus oedipus]
MPSIQKADGKNLRSSGRLSASEEISNEKTRRETWSKAIASTFVPEKCSENGGCAGGKLLRLAGGGLLMFFTSAEDSRKPVR